MSCEKSSNRNSIIIGRAKTQKGFYMAESPQDMYLRYGYKSYLSGDFRESIKYFKNYLKSDKSNYAVYLYISYAYEGLYKKTEKSGYLDSAKEFADYAQKLAPENEYVKEQVSDL